MKVDKLASPPVRWLLALVVCATVGIAACGDEEQPGNGPEHEAECDTDDDCGETEIGEWSECEDPPQEAGFCAETGEKTRTITEHVCTDAGLCQEQTEQETDECRALETEGAACPTDDFGCVDSAECRNEVCVGLEVDEGSCFIDEQCFVSGEQNPEDDCEFCDPALSRTNWASTCFAEVEAGHYHGCALDTSGGLDCWPDRDLAGQEWGQVRHRPEDGFFDELAVGSHFSCIADESTIECWGEGYGEDRDPGDGYEYPDADGPFHQLTLGGAHACVLDDDDEIHCWGDFTSQQSFTPDQIDEDNDIGDYELLAAGGEHTCVVDDANEVYCWGADIIEIENIEPDGLSEIVELSSGSAYSCALDEDGQIDCWDWGQAHDTVIEQVPDGSYEAISAGHTHACAIDTEGRLDCWGADNVQLEVPDEVDDIDDDTTLLDVSAGRLFSCVVTEAHELICWGEEDEDAGFDPAYVPEEPRGDYPDD